MGDRLGSERRLVLWSFVFVALTVMVLGVFMEQRVLVSQYGDERSFDSSLPVVVSQVGSDASSSRLKAMIKGSIYETGSNMTVFGACFDGDSYLLPGANASFTAWYPNGSVVTGPNASMEMIYDDAFGYHLNGTGRWKIHVTMGSVVGTYLTEIMCTYQGEWAVAYGEWQNPEWVARIGATQSVVNETYVLLQGVSENLSVFRNDTANNFSEVLSVLSGLNASGASSSEKFDELSWLVQAIDLNRWKLDTTAPFYVLGSGANMFRAVDMLGPDSIVMASSDGVFASWDGGSWSYVSQPSLQYRGVSVLPANQPYAWVVGTDNVSAIVAINGGNASVLGLSPSEGSAFNDVKVFQDPNNPSGAFRVYLLAANGNVYLSNDSGTTFGYVGVVGAGSFGRISQVVENHGLGAEVLGYSVMIGQGGSVLVTDGVNTTIHSVNGTVMDVDLLYADIGYVVVEDTSDAKVYKYDGVGLSVDYVIADSSVVPVSVEANAQDDVWVATRDPSTFFHFDGHNWQYSTFAYSGLVSVMINFGNASNVTGLYDMVLSDSRHGYAVGDDGLVLIYRQESADKFDQISQELGNLTAFVSSMNSSINYKLDNVLSNVTYTQLYLETTMYPLLNATYQNTLQILIDLGIIQGQLNQTLVLQNTTLGIVNETQQDVNELVNRSRRIRAWVTQ